MLNGISAQRPDPSSSVRLGTLSQDQAKQPALGITLSAGNAATHFSIRQLTEVLCLEFERMEAESTALRDAYAELLAKRGSGTEEEQADEEKSVLVPGETNSTDKEIGETSSTLKSADAEHLVCSGEKLNAKSAKVVANVFAKLVRGTEEEDEGDSDYVEESPNLTTNPYFELVFGFLIVSNAVIMALKAQYVGMEAGYDLEFIGYGRSADDTWPSADVVFRVLEMFFGVVFTLELVIKLAVLRSKFWMGLWNYFDSIVVGSWLLQIWVILPVNPLILRLLRLARLVRLVKLVRKLEAFDSLRVLFGSIGACGPVFIWSITVLCIFQMVVGLALLSFLSNYINNEDNPIETRTLVFAYFGTFSRSIITMWELTLGNYAAICRVLVDNVSELYGYVITAYKITVGFAVIKVISGVFLHETFKTASSDDDLMIVQKKRLQQKHARKMDRLMKQADESGDGALDRDELKKILSMSDVKIWLAAQDLEVEDVDLLFDLLDDGDGTISAQELTKGVARLKGSAKSIDLVGLMHMTSALSDEIRQMANMLRIALNPEGGSTSE